MAATDQSTVAGEQANKTGSLTESSLGLEANIAAVLAYILGPLSGVAFYALEEDSEFVQFHAMQSVLFSVAAIAVLMPAYIVIGILATIVPFLGLLSTLLMLPLAAVGLFVMFQAFNEEWYKLPVIGDYAEEHA